MLFGGMNFVIALCQVFPGAKLQIAEELILFCHCLT